MPEESPPSRFPSFGIDPLLLLAFNDMFEASNDPSKRQADPHDSQISLATPPSAPPQAQNALSIAVLPFANMSGIPEQEYFCDGIVENILTALSRFRDITVIARNSSVTYKNNPTRIEDIYRDLGVKFVLEGSVQKAGNRIRVNAQLLEGATGKHLWAEKYDRNADDMFCVMDEITELIVGILATTYGGRLRKVASALPAGTGPTNFRALDYFVQGMQELNKCTEDSILASIANFDQAVRIDPLYSKAHAKIAWAHLMNLSFGWSIDEVATLNDAQHSAGLALQSDDSEAWAYWAVAGCAMSALKHDQALLLMKRALELNPHDADILADMGIFCAYSGAAEEGLVYALRAIKINPHHPEYYEDQLGEIYFDARQYQNAILTFEGIRSLGTPLMLLYLAASNAALGDLGAAHGWVEKLLAREKKSTISYWTKLMSYRDERDLEHVAVNLRLAGLPE